MSEDDLIVQAVFLVILYRPASARSSLVTALSVHSGGELGTLSSAHWYWSGVSTARRRKFQLILRFLLVSSNMSDRRRRRKQNSDDSEHSESEEEETKNDVDEVDQDKDEGVVSEILVTSGISFPCRSTITQDHLEIFLLISQQWSASIFFSWGKIWNFCWKLFFSEMHFHWPVSNHICWAEFEEAVTALCIRMRYQSSTLLPRFSIYLKPQWTFLTSLNMSLSLDRLLSIYQMTNLLNFSLNESTLCLKMSRTSKWLSSPEHGT